MRIRFSLPRQQWILLTLRGPAPSCRAAGTATVRGLRGVNRLDFGGRVGRKSIGPGIYILSLLRSSSRLPVAQPLLVKVVSPRRTILLGDGRARRAACDGSAGLVSRSRIEAFVADLPASIPAGSPEGGTASAPAAPTVAPATRPHKRSAPPSRSGGGGGGVLGTHVDLPALPSPDDAPPWAFAAVVLLVGLPLLLMSVLVVRFLRGSWNP
ncbi:MAG TPA: hypothetical protein VM049_09740 [Gaiellaceae bacterium]|nr:hypothetical protein [Gaiellaceae bacterium]